MHPQLRQDVEMDAYQVKVGHNYVLHEVPTKSDAASAYQGLWVWLAPNVALNYYSNGLSIERMLPLGPDRMKIHYQYLFKPGANQHEKEHGLATSVLVTKEDVQITEAVQVNLQSGMYNAGRLSPRHEGGVHYFQQLVERALHS